MTVTNVCYFWNKCMVDTGYKYHMVHIGQIYNPLKVLGPTWQRHVRKVHVMSANLPEHAKKNIQELDVNRNTAEERDHAYRNTDALNKQSLNGLSL